MDLLPFETEAPSAEAPLAEASSWLSRLQFRASFSFATSDELYRGSSQVANPSGVETEFQMWSMGMAFQQDGRHRWLANLPYLDIEQRDNSGVLERTSGLGDLSLTHGWRPWEREPVEVLIGLEFPTGKELKAPAPGVVPASLLQPGSGTWDPILGLRWSHPGPGPLVQSAHVMGQFPIGESDAGLDPGNLYQAQYAWGWQVNDTLFASLGIEGIHRTPDSLLGSRLINTGSTLYALHPGVVLSLDGLNLFIGARLPVAIDVEDTQIAPGPFFEFWLSMD